MNKKGFLKTKCESNKIKERTLKMANVLTNRECNNKTFLHTNLSK